MPNKRRVAWDSDVIISYLKGEPRAEGCKDIIAAAEPGEIEIVVSAMAEAEVIRIDETSYSDETEDLISEFFERPYILPVSADSRVAREARRLSRKYRLKSPDAINLATAVLTPDVEAFETYNSSDFFDKVRDSSDPPTLKIRNPIYEKQTNF